MPCSGSYETLRAQFALCYHATAMIQAVFFDLYGTLAGFRPDRFDIQSQACARFGIEVTPGGILRGYALADAFMSEQNATVPVRLLDDNRRDEFFAEYERRVLRGCGVDVSLERAAEIWRAVRRIPYRMERFDDVLPAMDLLKQLGLGLGLISNLNTPGDQLADEMGISPYLDFTVTSGEVGVEKPHPPIFHEALRRAGVDAADAAHVGDQLSSDVEGAGNVGIQPVLLDRDRNHVGYTRCPRIETLMELPQMVGELQAGTPLA